MAGLGLLVMLDDIAALLDDVALMSKVAARNSTAMVDDVATMAKVAMRKTAGVLGDDLALNAEQVTGVKADRELPVVWAVAKGSLKNKAILVPAALAISAWLPWLITPLLMVGGAFLCFEGVEKVLEALHARPHRPASDVVVQTVVSEQTHVAPSSVRGAQARQMDPQAYEQQKISGAVRTDFILSAEIMAIALGTVSQEPLMEQLLVLAVVALGITVFVYGIVACIVRMDDVGMWLMRRPSGTLQALGRGVIAVTPYLMRTLSVVGTIAMFIVGGTLLVHGMAPVQAWLHHTVSTLHGVAAWGLPVVVHIVVGAVVGSIVVAVVHVLQRWRGAAAH